MRVKVEVTFTVRFESYLVQSWARQKSPTHVICDYNCEDLQVLKHQVTACVVVGWFWTCTLFSIFTGVELLIYHIIFCHLYFHNMSNRVIVISTFTICPIMSLSSLLSQYVQSCHCHLYFHNMSNHVIVISTFTICPIVSLSSLLSQYVQSCHCHLYFHKDYQPPVRPGKRLVRASQI